MTDDAGSQRLLVLAPTGRDAELAVRVLRTDGLDAEVAGSMPALCRGVAEGAAGAIVAEEALGPRELRMLVEVVEAQEPWSDLPVVVLAAVPRDPGRHATGSEPLGALGNVTVVDRPLRRRTLVSVARAALRARNRQYAARALLVRLRDAVTARDQFLALLGHELRNPLAAVDAAGVLLERGAPPERPLAIVRRQTRQLTRLVDDLLDVSRVTSGKVSLRHERVDLREIVLRAVEGAVLGGDVVTVSAEAPEPVHVHGDVARLDQVLTNLVGNATKYTPAGGAVRVSVAREGAAAVVRVRDDGIGIAAGDLARIFEPFVQLSSAIDRTRGGMGLGLTLVRTLVQMHGGTIEARSEGPGRGTEFEVRLPVADVEAAATPAGVAAPAVPRRDVLLVEDNDDARETLAMMLELDGHEVRRARDGVEAIAAARERRPQVALVDIGLPLLDGYEVARRLRAEHRDTVVLVALSGYGQQEDRARSAAAGFDRHLTKPADPREVQGILRDLPRRVSGAPGVGPTR